MIALKTHPGCRSGLLQLYAFRLSHAYVEVVVCLRYSAMVAFICHQQPGPQNHNLSYSSCKSLLALERAMEFGVIASAIGVVGVAAQTIEVITKVRSLVQEAGDAPSNIKNIAAELEILARALSGIEMQVRQTNQPAFSDPSPALLYCQQGIKQIAVSVTQLQSAISSSLINYASIRMAMLLQVLDRIWVRNHCGPPRELVRAFDTRNTVIANQLFFAV